MRLPVTLLAFGVLASIIGLATLATVRQFRTILLLGLNSADWLTLFVFGGLVLLALAGYLLWVVSGVHDRTEVALADGRSIVVTQNCWLHCSIEVSQRDGIFIDPLTGRGVTEWRIPLPESVSVDGDALTLALDGAATLTVTLR